MHALGLAMNILLLIPVDPTGSNLFRFPPGDSNIKCPTNYAEMKLGISNVF